MSTSNPNSVFTAGCRIFVICSALICASAVRADDDVRKGTLVKAGSSIDLFKQWPELAHAPKSQLATIELLIRPDAQAVARSRSFILTLSDSRGRDTSGIGLAMHQGTLRANVLGTALDSQVTLPPDRWTHIALTINTKSLNKRARLWINGKLVADELILEYWPKMFEVAEMFSDHWNLGRLFSGRIGDVRVSGSVRYTTPFEPPARLSKTKQTVLLLKGNAISLR
jgi:hypothetical protein